MIFMACGLPHHHINAGATCGRWWGGDKDETNIPHATSSDDKPCFYPCSDGRKLLDLFPNIRVVDENILKNPEWHTSPGGNSWVFLDEVIVE